MAKRRHIIIWSVYTLLVGGIAFICYSISQFRLFTPQVHDTVSVSPNGIYTATLHSVDTGAAGNCCQALLRKTADKDDSITAILVDGGYKFVDKIEWNGNQTLIVILDGPPDATDPKSWQGIKIMYK